MVKYRWRQKNDVVENKPFLKRKLSGKIAEHYATEKCQNHRLKSLKTIFEQGKS
jgi:hypothetical protein